MDEPLMGQDQALPVAPPEPVPERQPFWGYGDVLLFAGLAVPSMIAGFLASRGFFYLLGIRPSQAVELVAAQLVGYGLLFGALAVLFYVQHGRPFWRSLGWLPLTMPAWQIVVAGVGTAIAVALTGVLIRVPDGPNQMTELMRERSALILLGIFGTTVFPLCEELAFRGFIQPLLVRTMGAVPGIVLASLPFGFLHFWEYGASWRHALLISMAGAAFGWMRHTTGSTKAAALMHGAYNALVFAGSFGRTLTPQ
jgi:uncharacterized protein